VTAAPEAPRDRWRDVEEDEEEVSWKTV
jgi:hypothetical protein